MHAPCPARLLSVLLLASALAGCAGAAPERAGGDVATKLKMASLAAALGNRGEAASMLAPLAAEAPNDPDVQMQYVKALAAAGRATEALKAARAAQARGVGGQALDLLAGRLAIRSGNGAEAGQAFARVLQAAPEDAEALNGAGLARILQGDLPGAEAAFRQAAARAPDAVEARNNLGLTLALEGREDQAVTLLEQLRQDAPDSKRVRHNLALAYSAAGQDGKARALLTPDLGAAGAEEAVRAFAALADRPDGAVAEAAPDAGPRRAPPRMAVAAARDAPGMGGTAAEARAPRAAAGGSGAGDARAD